MKAISYTVDEVDPKLEGAWVLSLGSSLLHVDSLGLEGEHVSFVFGNKTGDFSCGEHRVYRLKETLSLDLRVCHDKCDLFSERTSLSVEVLDVILKMSLTVSLGKGNLEEYLLANKGSELG